MENLEKTTNVYEIRIAGRLPSRWFSWFDGFTIQLTQCDETVLVGEIVDQSALHGVLSKISGLNLELLSVNRIKEHP